MAEKSPASAGPRQRNKQARMQTIIDAALALFAEEGYSEVSTRRIAERAGCSETLLFRYFGGKRDLLLAIVNSTQELATSPDAGEASDVQDYIKTFFLQLFARMKEGSATQRVIGTSLLIGSEFTSDFERRHDQGVATIAAQLRNFQRAGAIAPDMDLESIATVIEQAGFSIGL